MCHKSPSWKVKNDGDFFFPHFARTDQSNAPLCATFGMAARNWNWTPLFKILDPPLIIILKQFRCNLLPSWLHCWWCHVSSLMLTKLSLYRSCFHFLSRGQMWPSDYLDQPALGAPWAQSPFCNVYSTMHRLCPPQSEHVHLLMVTLPLPHAQHIRITLLTT